MRLGCSRLRREEATRALKTDDFFEEVQQAFFSLFLLQAAVVLIRVSHTYLGQREKGMS
jgi:hypothetical protein